ncbi:MAG: class I SAM-dependent methyltransferase [Pyrinomonadaceae bacterium]
MINNPEFDDFADDYDAALGASLTATGEDKHYFARRRVEWLARRLRERGASSRSVLDFGCGTGSSTPYLFEGLSAESVVGIDVSPRSLDVARNLYGAGGRAKFETLDDYRPAAELDLAFSNGVFHHIPLQERARAVGIVHRALRPGGLFALWENNPWNPGTRYVMSNCAFDEDAITLSPPEARRLVRAGGFEVLGTDFLFIFPRALHFLRGLEPLAARLPLGGQYLVLCRKPEQAAATNR